MSVPSVIRAGMTTEFTVDATGYPASDGWTVYVAIKRQAASEAIILEGAGVGTRYTFVLSAETSATLPAGDDYDWQVYAEQTVDEQLLRYEIDRGTLTVIRFFGEPEAFDSRSRVKKILDAIEAVLEGRASKDQQSYTIAGRSLQRTPIADLIRLRQSYRQEYAREQAAERIARGLDGGGQIEVRFK